MIVHIVLMRLRDDLTEEERREFEAAAASLADVSGVEDMTWGPDFSGRGKGFTHAAVIHLTDRDALATYQRDELHRNVVAIFDRLLREKLVIDYETGRSGISG